MKKILQALSAIVIGILIAYIVVGIFVAIIMVVASDESGSINSDVLIGSIFSFLVGINVSLWISFIAFRKKIIGKLKKFIFNIVITAIVSITFYMFVMVPLF